MHKFHKSGSDKKFNLSLDIYLLIHRYFENTKMIIQDFVHDSYQQKCLYVLSFVYLLYVPRRGFFSYWLDCSCQVKCHKFRPMVLRAVLVRVIYHMLMTVKSQDLDFKSHSKDLRPLLPHALCLPKDQSLTYLPNDQHFEVRVADILDETWLLWLMHRSSSTTKSQ